MVNSQQISEVIDAFKVDLRVEKIPSSIPVVETNPKIVRNIEITYGATATDATSATILTTPTDKDFFILGSILSTSKSSAATALFSTITCTINGLACVINKNIHNASAAANVQSPIWYGNHPIKVDRGTNITVTNSTNNTFIQSSGLIFGYYDQP